MLDKDLRPRPIASPRLARRPALPLQFRCPRVGRELSFGLELLGDLRGFAERLGGGTLAKGGDDIDILLRTLEIGTTISHEPWHEHPADWPRLRRQSVNYGMGLGALPSQMIRRSDRVKLLGRVPHGVAHLLSRSSHTNAGKGGNHPRRLDLLEAGRHARGAGRRSRSAPGEAGSC
jgi:hypothetical protein